MHNLIKILYINFKKYIFDNIIKSNKKNKIVKIFLKLSYVENEYYVRYYKIF